MFWRECHDEVLQPQVNDKACRAVAEILHELRRGQHGRELFYITADTGGLVPRDLAQVRFFTAPQDFRGSTDLEKVFEAYREDPDRFAPQIVLDDVDAFLKTIMTEAEANEQRDKREKYAKTCAKLLLDNDCDAFGLAEKFGNSARRLRQFLSEENVGSGFASKKCDMFLRDMLVWRVWNLTDVEYINVASDTNTMRVALRTRILTTAIPLLSSFLDVFCHQYGLIDAWNAKAWRRVWEMWLENHSDTCPECPALLDFFVYGIIGREFCKDSGLSVLQCDLDPQHIVYWPSAQKKVCPLCRGPNWGHLSKKSQHLPCTHDQGKIAIQHSRFVTGDNATLPGITECPFVPVCEPRDRSFRRLIAPDSISIFGPTSWTTAYTTEEQGGGGLSA
jgi:hypothetical protein